MPTLSARIPELHASPIREILAVINRPGMISFAGGLPSPDSFPDLSLEQLPREMLQYGSSEGEPALRAQICDEMRGLGLQCEPSQVLVLSGSQQGIDLVGKLMVDRDSLIALENPSYLAALQVFRFFGARFATLDRQSPGTALARADRPRLCYVIPTFQNPTGYCYTAKEREQLASSCEQQDVVLFEDDPYRDLVFDPCDRQPICSFMQTGSWVYQGSFSKSIAPGLRLGFLVASKNLMPYLTRLKQAADLHSNRISQHLILQTLQNPARQQRLLHLQQHYREKRDAFENALVRHLASKATWQSPKGGLFFWLHLQRQIDTQSLLRNSLEHGVAFMPGEPFFHGRSDDGNSAVGNEAGSSKAGSYLRLNFSHASAQQADQGLQLLSHLLGET
jgi:2-aminoadipate transaminase